MANIKAFMAGVADAIIWVGDQLLLEAKTLADSSITIGVTAEEIRGGKGANLVGRYFHTSVFSIELNDILFQLDYIALNSGSVITQTGADVSEQEFTAVQANTLEVDGTPSEFLTYGRIGWYAPVGTDDWKMFTFDTGTNTSSTATGIVPGQVYCIRYINNSQCEEVVIPADFVPSEVTLILKADLFKASKGEGNNPDTKVGKVEIEVPRFQLNGNMDLALNMTGAAQTPLSGQALSTTDGTAGCTGNGYYSKIRRIDFNSSWKDNVIGLAVDGSDDVSMASGDTVGLNIWGVFKGNTASKVLSPEDLVYTVEDTAVATVEDGIITAVATGTTTIKVELKAEGAKTYTVSEIVKITVS